MKKALHKYLEDHFKTFQGKVDHMKKQGYSDEVARKIVGDAIYHGGGDKR